MNILVDCRRLNIEEILLASSLAKSLKEKNPGNEIYFCIPYVQPLSLVAENPFITGVSTDPPRTTKGYDAIVSLTADAVRHAECQLYTVPKHDREIAKDFLEMMRDNDQKIVTYQAGMNIAPKVLNDLRKRCHMIRVGANTGLYDPDNSTSLFATEASMIKASDFFLGISGIYSTLASGLNTKKLILDDFDFNYPDDILLENIIWNIEQ